METNTNTFLSFFFAGKSYPSGYDFKIEKLRKLTTEKEAFLCYQAIWSLNEGGRRKKRYVYFSLKLI